MSCQTAPCFGCDDCDALGELRYGSFARRIEEAFGAQLAFQLFELSLLVAGASGFDGGDDDLKVASGSIDSGTPLAHD